MSNDWLVGGDRDERARRRLYSVAADIISEVGVDRLDLNDLARRAHCSRATIYRHTGGKKRLIEAVLTQTSAHLAERIRAAIVDTTGSERARRALLQGVYEARNDPVARQFLRSAGVLDGARVVTRSPAVTQLAAELIGLDNDVAAAFAVRSMLGLLLWPAADAHDETEHIRMLVEAVMPERHTD